MPTNTYHFITHWRMQATVKEISDIFQDVASLPLWWGSVYLDVKILEPGASNGIGRKIALYTKGWLPYTLRWDFVVTEVSDDRLSLAAQGDFVGRGVWTFKQGGDFTDITYDWQIAAEKPLLKRLSFFMKPVFAMNHHWAMAKGEESLRLELLRRRAKTPQERAAIPAPPLPTPSNPLKWLGAVIIGQ